MKITKSSIIGMLVLGLLAIAVALLFVHPAAEAEDVEKEIETIVPIHAGQIVKTTLHGYEITYGRVQATPAGAKVHAGHIELHAAIDGMVDCLSCSPGQHVEQGDILLKLDTRLAELDLTEKQQRLNYTKKEFDRQTRLLKIEGASEMEVALAERRFHEAEQALGTAQVLLDFHTLRAPISGTVSVLSASSGQNVQTGQTLGEIVNTTGRVLSMQLPATSIEHIQQNMPVQIETDAGWTDAGTVGYMAEALDPKNGTLEIRSTLPPDSALRIGRFVRARILSETHAGCLAVPAEALVTNSDGETYIAVINEDRASRLPVEGKLREAGWIEVEGDGLAEGMQIATEGAYGLPEETRIEVIGR